MITGKYVNYKMVADRLFDLGIPPNYIHDDEIKEIIFDIIDKIGAPNLYFDKIAEIEISSGYGELPCDFHLIGDGGVKHKNTGIALVYSPNLYHRTLYTSDAESAVEDVDSMIEGSNTLLTTVDIVSGEPSYKLENNYIYTGFGSGTVVMNYQAFPTDDNGDPLIPDNVKVINCVLYGLAARIGFRMYMKDQLAEKKYDRLEQEALWYMGAAQNAARIPNQDQMEILSNIWTDPLRDSGHHKGYFGYLTRRSRFRTHNHRK